MPPGRVRSEFKQLIRIFVGGAGDGRYACPRRSGAPAIETLPLFRTVGHAGDGDLLQQILGGYLALSDAIGDLGNGPQDRVRVEAGEALVVFQLRETLE